jgi:hypothetical protein
VATLGTTSKPAYVYDTETDTWIPIGVGAHTHTLTAADVSGVVTQTNYDVAGKNKIINGGFDIWQRGTSISQSGTGGTVGNYTADRWVYGGSGGSAATISRQLTSDLTTLPHVQYCARFQRNSGNSDLSTLYFAQVFENVNSTPLVGKEVVFSFYARAGANYSASSLSAVVGYGTGTDQALFSFTGTGAVAGSSVALTTSWQRFTLTGTVATAAKQLRIYFGYPPTGTAGANDYFEITGLQLELGSTATPFSRAASSIGEELALCQRYYEKSYAQATAPQTNTTVNRVNVANHFNSTTGISSATIFLKVTKRSTPTITLYRGDGSATNPNFWEYTVGTNEVYANPTVANIGDNNFSVGFNGTASGTANNATLIRGHYVAEAEL